MMLPEAPLTFKQSLVHRALAYAKASSSASLGVALMLLGVLAALLLVWGASRQLSPGFELARVLEPSAAQQTAIGLPVRKLIAPIAGIQVGMTVTGIATDSVQLGVTASVVLRESQEPMQYFAQLRQFHAADQLLHDMQGQTVRFTFSDGSVVQRPLAARGLKSLGSYFWVPLFAGLFVYSLGCALLLVARRESMVWVYFGMICAYSATAFSRAWFGDRHWGYATWVWELCSFATRSGAMLILALAIMLIWHVPRTVGKKRTPWLIAASIGTFWLLDRMQFIEPRSITYHWPLAGYLVLFMGIGVVTWRRGGLDLPQRVAARWFFLLTGIALVVISFKIIGLAVGYVMPHHGQIITAINVLPFVGISAFLAKSQIFRLEGWWWRIWLWLSGGALVLLVDVLLVALLGASQGVALAVALALAGWLYFPLRQWVMGRFSLQSKRRLEDFVAPLLELSAMRAGSVEAQSHWRHIVDTVFEPLRIETQANVSSELFAHGQGIANQGMELWLPDLNGQSLCLVGAKRGTRLFNPQDALFAQTLTRLALHAGSFEASYHQGALQERKRIAADLHDDIGGKLLHLANQNGADGQYARNALEDLRTITRGLSTQTRSLGDVLADIQYQLAQRAERQSVGFEWQVDIYNARDNTVGSRQATVLASICSELMRNAMQHSRIGYVHFAMASQAGQWQLICTSDGAVTDPSQWSAGLGTTSIRRRVHDLQGQCSWAARAGGGVSFKASWPLDAWLHSDTAAFALRQAPSAV